MEYVNDCEIICKLIVNILAKLFSKLLYVPTYNLTFFSLDGAELMEV